MPSAWGWFTGSDRAQRQAMDTANRNTGFINSGRDREQGFYGGARDAARDYIQPYEQQGRAGQTAYTNALGLNGAEGRQNALAMYGQGMSPYLSDDINRRQVLGDRRAAATGQLNSGMNALARARVGAEMGTQDYNNWMSQLQGVGQQGFGAANALAANEMQYAQSMGGAERAATQGLVGNNTQLGNALSASQISPMRYIMDNAAMAIQAFSGRPGQTGGRPATGNNFTPQQMQQMNGYF